MREILLGLLAVALPLAVAAQPVPPGQAPVSGAYSTVERDVEKIDARVLTIRDRLQDMESAITVRTQRMEYLSTWIKRNEAHQARLREVLKRKWVGLYKGVLFDEISVWSSHAEFSGYLESIFARDRDIIEEYGGVKEELAVSQQEMDRHRRALEKDLEDFQVIMRTLKSELDKKGTLLASVSAEALEVQSRMDRLLERLGDQATRRDAAEIFRHRGTLPWPAPGPLVRAFGTYREEGAAQVSRGIDIQGLEGTPITSVYPGKVVFTDWVGAYGYTIIVDHGGGVYSLYGHLEKVLKQTGQVVEGQEVVGLMGQSGNVLRPTLHFEIRLHDRPEDPLRWLKNR